MTVIEGRYRVGLPVMERSQDVRSLGEECVDDGGVEMNYEITFTQGMTELMAEASGMEKMALAMLKMAVGDFEEGDTMEDTTSLTFVDSENGWQPL